ncbi:unnamed protein product, partial [Polarella glacialis]
DGGTRISTSDRPGIELLSFRGAQRGGSAADAWHGGGEHPVLRVELCSWRPDAGALRSRRRGGEAHRDYLGRRCSSFEALGEPIISWLSRRVATLRSRQPRAAGDG